jgi:hypothetical protein
VSSTQFDAHGNAVAHSEGGNVMPFQQLNPNSPGKFDRSLQVRANEGPQRLIVGGGNADTWREVEQLHAAKFNSASDLKPADAGVSNSARGALQSPIAAANLKPTDIVKLPNGYEVTAAAAVTLGHLRPRAGGGYEDTHAPAQTPAAQPQPQPQVAPEEIHTPLEADYADTANAVKHYLSPSLTARAVEELATTGQMSPDVLREASDQMNAEHEVVHSMMQKVREGYGRQFEQHAVKAGAVPQQFTQWAQANRPDALKLAMVTHVTRQDPRAYNALLTEFKARRR